MAALTVLDLEDGVALVLERFRGEGRPSVASCPARSRDGCWPDSLCTYFSSFLTNYIIIASQGCICPAQA